VAKTDADRAELIRVQLEHTQSRRGGQPAGSRARAYTRERILLDKHKDTWARAVMEIPGVQFVKFMRGFVEQVDMSARDFLAHGAGVFERAPILHLDLVELKALAAQVFESPLLARIHSMRLWRNQLGDDEVKLLAASPHLGNLRWIDLTYNSIGQDGVEAMCASRNLNALRFVDFADNPGPNPAPQIGETDTMTNEICGLTIPEIARSLEARFGKKAWLSGPFDTAIFPPERDMF
jgi:hypothetical protein